MKHGFSRLGSESPRTCGLFFQRRGAVGKILDATDDPFLGLVASGATAGEVEMGELTDGHDLEGILEKGDVIKPDDPPLILNAWKWDQESTEQYQWHQCWTIKQKIIKKTENEKIIRISHTQQLKKPNQH